MYYIFSFNFVSNFIDNYRQNCIFVLHILSTKKVEGKCHQTCQICMYYTSKQSVYQFIVSLNLSDIIYISTSRLRSFYQYHIKSRLSPTTSRHIQHIIPSVILDQSQVSPSIHMLIPRNPRTVFLVNLSEFLGFNVSHFHASVKSFVVAYYCRLVFHVTSLYTGCPKKKNTVTLKHNFRLNYANSEFQTMM